MTNGDLLYFNGINGRTGQYLLPPMTREELANSFIIGAKDPENLPELKARYERKTHGFLGVKEGVDATKLSEAGWGIIFAAADQDRVPAIMEALKQLLDLRREQAGDRYKEYTGANGFQGPSDSKTRFLSRQKVGPGPVDPDKVPYYLLIVGDPQAIPYSFQYQLDVQYAVGRIHFDTLDEYAQYARSVVMTETGKVTLPRRAAFFGVQNLDDPATAMSATELVAPLAKQLAATQSNWTFESILSGEAKKARLAQLLGGVDTPALLFTASHGMYFPPDDPRKRQLPHQGALLCSDWRPHAGSLDIPQDYYLAADDVGHDARLLGLVAFHFACFGAGTPQLDDYAHSAPSQRAAIAPQAFVAQLPRRLLGHPKGGALAVIGHIERAFPCSFTWDQAGAQLTAFESALQRIMQGQPVGFAVEYFNERYSELSTVLSEALGDIGFGKQPNLTELTGMWMANNDARNYVIIGDPAVRLPLAQNGASGERPSIAAVEIHGLAIADKTQANPTLVTSAPSPSPAAAPPAQPDAGSGSDGSVFEQVGRMPGFTPWPVVPAEADKQKHPELYAAWVQHLEAGYKNSDSLFSQILQAFMRSHYSTVVMYWVLFVMGVGFFITGIVLAVQKGESVTGLVFGGLSVVSFLTYFITRPSQTLEENLLYITWLGMLYNSYWTHLNWSSDGQTAQAELDKATENAITQIKELIASHAATVKQRPGLLSGRRSQGKDAAIDSAGDQGKPSPGSG